MSLASESSSEEELKKRPSFEDWCDQGIRGREDYVVLKTNVLYYGTMANIGFCRHVMLQLGKEHNGMAPADSDEFKEAQKLWWHYYKKLMVLRSFLLRYFDIAAPNWQVDIMPERYYCGVLLSEEDFKKFLITPGSGLKVLEPENADSYSEELKKKKEEKKEYISDSEEEEQEKEQKEQV